MLTVDKELSSGKFKINVFKSDYLSTEFIVKFVSIFTFLTLDIRDLKSRLGQTAKALGLVSPLILFIISTQKLDCEQSLIFSFESQGTDSTKRSEGRSEGRASILINFFARRACL